MKITDLKGWRDRRRVQNDMLAELDQINPGTLDRKDRQCPDWCTGRHEWPTLHIAEVGLVDVVVDAIQMPNPAVQLYDTRMSLNDAAQLARDLLRAVEVAQR